MRQRLLKRASHVSDVLVEINHGVRWQRTSGVPCASGATIPNVPAQTNAATDGDEILQRQQVLARLSLAQLGARTMVEQLDRVLRHEPGTRAGAGAEELHKMRVATRRLRVAFRVFGDELAADGVTDLPEDAVKAVGRALGEVRDLDVFAEWLAGQATDVEGDAPALSRLREQRLLLREDARGQMVEALDGAAMDALRGDIRERLRAVGEPGFQVPGDGVKKRDRVARAGKRLADRALRKLRRKGNALMAPTSEELHEVRISAKRFRYVCEFLKPAFGSVFDEAIEKATAIQDTLGDLHDADVAAAVLLQDIQRVVGERSGRQDAAPIARLVAAQHDRREAALRLFREQWQALPGKHWLKQKKAEAAHDDGG